MNIDSSRMFDEGQDVYAALGDSHWWLTGRYGILESYIKHYASSGQTRFLDAGCGPAVFLKRISQFIKGDLYGIDNSSHGLSLARARMPSATFLEGDICSLPFDENYFDLMLADDVIEHIDDDVLALSEIFRTLKKGGHAFFCVPAFKMLWGYHDEKYGHKRRYTMVSFKNAVTKAGFKIESIVYGQALFFVPLLLFRVFKNSIKSTREDFSPLPHWVNRILCALVRFDFYLCKLLHLPFGCNIFCVASKE